MPKNIDQLTEDEQISNQLWCCISFLSPETLKNCNFRAIKIRGVYGTKEEATKRADYLQKIDPDFNIYVGEVGKWLGWDPDPNTIDDQVYREKKLQDIMDGYKKNREKAKIMEEERKREMLEESVRNEATKHTTAQNKLRRKYEKKKLKEKMDQTMKNLEDRFPHGEIKPDGVNNTTSSSHLKEQEQIVCEEKKRIDNNDNIIKESISNLSSVDSKLNELQAYYKKLVAKKNAPSSI
jgi:hypothetical protein